MLEIFFFWSVKLIQEPLTSLYLLKKIFKIPLRKLSFKRKGCLITLIGVNGSGKSTVSKLLLERYQSLLAHLGKRGYYYYYGWKPTFPLTKLLSKMNKVQSFSSFKSDIKDNQKDFSLTKYLIQECSFIYQWLEYLYRYYTEIKPKLNHSNLVITDRYFYDLYGQYPYSSRSIFLPLLMRLFPKPNALYLLDAPITELLQRKKTEKDSLMIIEKARTVLPQNYLLKQKQNYHLLSRYLNLKKVDNSKQNQDNLDFIASSIITNTWSRML